MRPRRSDSVIRVRSESLSFYVPDIDDCKQIIKPCKNRFEGITMRLLIDEDIPEGEYKLESENCDCIEFFF